MGDDIIISGYGNDQNFADIEISIDSIVDELGHDIIISGKGDDFNSADIDESFNFNTFNIPGNDLIISGEGNDINIGGHGRDIFLCGPGYDIILDFNPEEGDIQAGCENINDSSYPDEYEERDNYYYNNEYVAENEYEDYSGYQNNYNEYNSNNYDYSYSEQSPDKYQNQQYYPDYGYQQCIIISELDKLDKETAFMFYDAIQQQYGDIENLCKILQDFTYY